MVMLHDGCGGCALGDSIVINFKTKFNSLSSFGHFQSTLDKNLQFYNFYMLKAICIFCLLVVRINPWCDINNEFISSDNLFYLNLSEWGQTEQDCGVSGLFTLMWTCWVCGADSPR